MPGQDRPRCCLRPPTAADRGASTHARARTTPAATPSPPAIRPVSAAAAVPPASLPPPPAALPSPATCTENATMQSTASYSAATSLPASPSPSLSLVHVVCISIYPRSVYMYVQSACLSIWMYTYVYMNLCTSSLPSVFLFVMIRDYCQRTSEDGNRTH